MCGMRPLLILAVAASPFLLAQEPAPVPQAVAALAHLQPRAHDGPVAWTAGPYSYDGVGNIKNIGSETFFYDKAGRLKSASVRGPDLSTLQTQTFVHDEYGNLTSTFKLGQAVSLPVDGTTNHLQDAGYDAAGNLTALGAERYDYDAMGMPSAIHIGSDPQPRVIYAYTADDERLFTFDVAANTTHWTLRGFDAKVLRDFKQSGNGWSVDRDYVYRDGLLLAALRSNGAVEHYTLDHLGTPRLITDGAGHKIGYHVYWPFGEEWTAGGGQEGNPLKFTGHERDADLADAANPSDYLHARCYRPVWGRFTTPDPAGWDPSRPQAWNRYAYTTNNPLVSIDPDGRAETPVIAGLRAVGKALDDGPFGNAAMNEVSGAVLDVADYLDASDDLQNHMLGNRPLSRDDLLAAAFKAGRSSGKVAMRITPAGEAEGGAARLKPSNLPAWKKIDIDIAHIVDRHTVGGAATSESASKFAGMSAKQIERVVRQAYRYGQKIKTRGDRVLIRGSYGKLQIDMWVNTVTRVIETAYTTF